MSAVDRHGRPREPFLSRLRDLVRECNRRGIVVDVTLSRGNGVTGPARLPSAEDHGRAVETLLKALQPQRNWYLDLANERNIQDKRFIAFDELRQLRQLARRVDAKRLITASHAGDLRPNDVRQYIQRVGVDFLSPHRPRDANSARQTEKWTRQYQAWMNDLGRIVPIHYQEPFRRGFSRTWEPSEAEFLTDARGALRAGAAGWCFHNGDQRDKADGRPRRSFDLSEHRLFEQLDPVQRRVVESLHGLPANHKGRF